MIHESEPWKRDLLKDVEVVARWSSKQPSERRSILVEKRIFQSAYAMRKLLEAQRLSSKFRNFSIKCEALQAISELILLSRPDRFDKNYDWENPQQETLSAPAILDLVIHSFVFVEEVDEDGRLIAFYATSDRKKSKLYRIALVDFFRL